LFNHLLITTPAPPPPQTAETQIIVITYVKSYQYIHKYQDDSSQGHLCNAGSKPALTACFVLSYLVLLFKFLPQDGDLELHSVIIFSHEYNREVSGFVLRLTPVVKGTVLMQIECHGDGGIELVGVCGVVLLCQIKGMAIPSTLHERE
jgi:hypothetical protein